MLMGSNRLFMSLVFAPCGAEAKRYVFTDFEWPERRYLMNSVASRAKSRFD